jgi:trimeric autotransporter adhesin
LLNGGIVVGGSSVLDTVSLNSLVFNESASTRTLSTQTRTTNAAGTALTVSAGNAGAGASAFSGGTLTLQGGNAAGTGNANGGGVAITGGTGIGTGVLGLVSLAPTTFLSSGTAQSFGVNSSVTGVDSYSTISVNATATALTVTVPVPNASNQVVGRILYVSAANGTNDFSLALANTSGVPSSYTSVAMKANSTATLIWNGFAWTAAGASSSTDLQSAYNNTLTSAGGAELILNAPGGNADGLTIRNNGTTPITGGLLEVQTSIGSNLFSVNNNATEYASNGGAETAGGTSTTFPSNTWDTTTGGTVSRYVTAGDNIATGQASVSVVTSAQNHGARNRVTAALTSGLTYTASFAIRGTTNFSNLEVRYSPDGTTTGTTQCNPATTPTTYTVTSGQWTRVSCSFVASGTITASNSMLIRYIGTSGFPTYYIDNLSINVNASSNFAGDGSADNAGTFATNWGDYEAGSAVTVAQETSVIYEGSASARAIITPATANVGIRNNMSITPSINTQFLVSFYARSTTTMTGSLAVGFLPAGGTGLPTGSAQCVDYSTQTLSANTWTKITCLLTTPGSGISNPDLVIYQTDSAARTIYVDALSITLNTNNSNNVQIGGGNKGGPTTLFTLDRSNTAPIAAYNDTYLGSMYYDTSTGRIQCYEADGWGACGAAPDTSVVLTPEYTGDVLNGSGIGTLTADFCSNQSGVLQVNTSFCASGLSRNYYRWTSPQATEQTYSIYVSYKLPSTFKAFNDDGTINVTALSDDTANSSVTYEVFRSTGGAVARCYDGVTTETQVTLVDDTWRTAPINGNEATGCSFAAGDNVIFKINVKARSNASVYVENLTFTYTNK